MFIRKETATIIKPFDYSTLVITDDIVSPDEDDGDLIDDIHELDEYMENSDDYDEFEDLLYSIVDESKERFSKWLVDKGLSEYAETFPDCIELYLNFIYEYSHRSIITLKSMPPIYLSEFFEDFLIRKMMVENPNEYVLWGPAIKLFYRFLFEKGYIDSDSIVKEIDRIEPAFIKILKKQFT
jgi:hypothetical protein